MTRSRHSRRCEIERFDGFLGCPKFGRLRCGPIAAICPCANTGSGVSTRLISRCESATSLRQADSHFGVIVFRAPSEIGYELDLRVFYRLAFHRTRRKYKGPLTHWTGLLIFAA
jgi:hypothetical protein